MGPLPGLTGPTGIGVQGFADTLALLNLAWVDDDGKTLNPTVKLLNIRIFECMYYAALEESMWLAKKYGPHTSFKGSPLSFGKFQFDLAGHPNAVNQKDWEPLRTEIMIHGVRNSLLIALMPTASSAQILSNNECFEPFNSLISTRTVLGGQFMIVNKYMVKDLKAINEWTPENINTIVESGSGSMQNISATTNEKISPLKRKYLTAYEIPQRVLLDLAIDRSDFICQTASQNCFMARPTRTALNAYHFYGWKGGLKTGMYYLRQLALTNPINMALTTLPQTTHTAEVKKLHKLPVTNDRPGSQVFPKNEKITMVCNDEVCVACQT